MNRRLNQDDKIDLEQAIRALLKERILIFSLTLIFLVIGYIYGKIQPKIYKSEIIIREKPLLLYEEYLPFLISNQLSSQQKLQEIISKEFNHELKLYLSSVDLLVDFAQQYNEIYNLKTYLRNKNINVREFLKKNLELIYNAKNNTNTLSLVYEEPFLGEIFLNDYVIFVQKKTFNTFKEQTLNMIVNKIRIYEQNLEIAKKINLEESIFKSQNSNGVDMSENYLLFYHGSKVLSQQIVYLKRLFTELKDQEFVHNLVLEKSSSSIISKPSLFLAINTSVIGFFLSLAIIFIKINLKHKI